MSGETFKNYRKKGVQSMRRAACSQILSIDNSDPVDEWKVNNAD